MKIWKFEYNAPVTLTFVLLCIAAYLLDQFTGGRATPLLFMTYRTSLADPLMYVRLFGHVLGHASLSHLTGNMIYILLLGPMLEEKYGSQNLLEMILVTALVTGICNNVFFSTALLGASGVVYMMIILSSMASFHKGYIPITAIVVIIVFLGQEVVDGLFAADNIAHLTHIIGGVCGCAFGGLIADDGRKSKK